MSTTDDIKMRDVNLIRRNSLIRTFIKAVGRKVFILTEELPFIVIGYIKEVSGDYIFVTVETTHLDPLEGKNLRIHVDKFEVFYIEDPRWPIPIIKNDCEARGK